MNGNETDQFDSRLMERGGNCGGWAERQRVVNYETAFH